MNIKIWFDFQCPFCYMGEKKLDDVLKSIELAEPVIIEYKAYELNPKAPEIPTETMTQHFMGDHTLTQQEAEERMAKVTKMAEKVGLHYNLPEAKVCNSLDAHRLMKFASERINPGKLKKLSFSIFKAEFEEEALISDRQLLAALAEGVGLQAEEVMAMFESEAYIKEVREDEAEIDARSDFEYVPFMLLDNGTVKQGAVSEKGLSDWLLGAMGEDDSKTTNPETEEEIHDGCSSYGCKV